MQTTFRPRKRVHQYDDNDVGNQSLKLLPLSEVILGQLNKLEKIVDDSNVSDVTYHLRWLRNVFLTAKKEQRKGAKSQLLIPEMFNKKKCCPACDTYIYVLDSI